MPNVPVARRKPLARRAVLALAAGTTVAASACAPGRAAAPTATTPAGWTLAWSDEFDAPAGASFDRAKWVADTGGRGFGNRERQFYTTDAQNVAHDGAGHLVITARPAAEGASLECWYGPCRFTSARLKTKGRLEQTYGRFEARLKLPTGQGIWPAFWMLGADIDGVGWPASGEIDIMEHIGREPRTIYGTIHGPGYSGAEGISAADTLPVPAANDFHVFALEWEPNELRWLLDGRVYVRRTPADLPAGARWVFDHPHFLLLNLAVGGNWPGDPDATSTYPQRLVVDYVRVYRR